MHGVRSLKKAIFHETSQNLTRDSKCSWLHKKWSKFVLLKSKVWLKSANSKVVSMKLSLSSDATEKGF